MNFQLRTITLMFLTLCLGSVSQAEELGEFQLQHFMLEPQFNFRESGAVDLETNTPARSGFELRNALVGVSWRKDSTFSGYLGIGSLRLINKPARSGAQPTGYGIYEAFAEMHTGYGTLRAGLVPVLFGIEGRSYEFALELPRSLLFQARQMGLRDYGASYFVDYGSFYSGLTVQNGEGGDDTDNRTYQTAIWGWHAPTGLHVGLSGQVGRYVDPVKLVETKTRLANAFVLLKLYGVGFAVEGTSGENRILETPHAVYDWHADIYHRFNKWLGAVARYDEADIDTDVNGNKRTEITAGLSLRDENSTSIVYLYGIKRLKENDQDADDEVRVVWRLTSSKPSQSQTNERFE